MKAVTVERQTSYGNHFRAKVLPLPDGQNAKVLAWGRKAKGKSRYRWNRAEVGKVWSLKQLRLELGGTP